MRNRNLWVLAAAAAVILLVLALALLLPDRPRRPSAVLENSQHSQLADAYLLVTVKGTLFEPIALEGETEYTIRQPDGTENVIHVTPDSICMKSSTCDNQDCVLQGMVSLDNMSSRVLGNMIICLPNEVTLELHTPQSLAEALPDVEEAP